MYLAIREVTKLDRKNDTAPSATALWLTDNNRSEGSTNVHITAYVRVSIWSGEIDVHRREDILQMRKEPGASGEPSNKEGDLDDSEMTRSEEKWMDGVDIRSQTPSPQDAASG